MPRFVENETPIDWNNQLEDRLREAGRVLQGSTYAELVEQLRQGEVLVGTGGSCPTGYHDFGLVIQNEGDFNEFKSATYDYSEDRARWYQFGKKRRNSQKPLSRSSYYAVPETCPTFVSKLKLNNVRDRREIRIELNNIRTV